MSQQQAKLEVWTERVGQSFDGEGRTYKVGETVYIFGDSVGSNAMMEVWNRRLYLIGDMKGFLLNCETPSVG